MSRQAPRGVDGEVMMTWQFSYDHFEKNKVTVAAYRVQGHEDDDRTVSIDIDRPDDDAGFGLYLSRAQARSLALFLLLITNEDGHQA